MNIYLECIFKEETYKENAAFKTLILDDVLLWDFFEIYSNLPRTTHKVYQTLVQKGAITSRNIGLQARLLAFKHQGSQNICIFSKKTNLNAKSCKLALGTLVWKPGYLISSTRVHKRNAFSQINQSRMQNLYAKNCWLPLRKFDLEGSVLAFKHQGSQNRCIFSNKTTRRNEAEMQNPDAKSC